MRPRVKKKHTLRNDKKAKKHIIWIFGARFFIVAEKGFQDIDIAIENMMPNAPFPLT